MQFNIWIFNITLNIKVNIIMETEEKMITGDLSAFESFVVKKAYRKLPLLITQIHPIFVFQI